MNPGFYYKIPFTERSQFADITVVQLVCICTDIDREIDRFIYK